jgi:uncharacterized protein (DUF1015 family)
MAKIRSFRALRPAKGLESKVASVPYDVINSEEAKKLSEGNPYSFLHVTRSEIDLPGVADLHSDPIYEKARENFRKFRSDNILQYDPSAYFYVYSQKWNNRLQVGLVALTSVDEYDTGLIKKHEKTREDKENDRTRHVMTLQAHAEPVFLCYRAHGPIDAVIRHVMQAPPINRFTSDDGIEHTLWIVSTLKDISSLIREFEHVPCLYVADGHHRSASASRTRAAMMKDNPAHSGDEEYNFFLSVIFPDNQLAILPYNRLVKDLNGRDAAAFLKAAAEKFEVVPEGLPAPEHPTEVSMYLAGKWVTLKPRPGTYDRLDPIKSLDVSILQDNLLRPLLGIDDPRRDKRIDFCGGIRGTGELVRLVDSGKAAVAFSMFPTTVAQLMAIADKGEIMPPKSTWFEPKLRSGLFVHTF